jgi:hypothetical protein
MEAVELVEFLAGTEHDVEICDTHDPAVAAAAVGYGIRRLPAVVIDGQLTDCCAEPDLDEEILTEAIFGGNIDARTGGADPDGLPAVAAGGRLATMELQQRMGVPPKRWGSAGAHRRLRSFRHAPHLKWNRGVR